MSWHSGAETKICLVHVYNFTSSLNNRYKDNTKNRKVCLIQYTFDFDCLLSIPHSMYILL